MNTDSVLDLVVREYADFHLDDTDEQSTGSSYENHCEYARLFRHWGTELLAEYVEHDPTPLRLAQAKVLLLDRYFEWRASVPKSHRNRIGENGHICLHHTFEWIFLQIRLKQLSIMPVQVFNPPPTPPPPSSPQIAGILLGEEG